MDSVDVMTSNDRPSWNVAVAELPKIPRKVKIPVPLAERFSNTVMNQYQHAYCGRTVLLIGDNSIRTLYFDLCKMLWNGRLLDHTQAASQSGHDILMDGETILLNHGSIGSVDFMDIRHFSLPESVIDLYFVFIPTLFGDKVENCLNFLANLRDRPFFDVIVTSCYLSDLSYRKVNSPDTNFESLFKGYQEGLNDFLHRLRKIERFPCLKKSKKLFWLTPMPQDSKMKEDCMKSFIEISKATKTIAKNQRFKIINRLETWLQADQELVMKETGHLSKYGVRTVNDILMNKTLQLFNRKYRKEESPKKRPVDQFTKDAAVAGWLETKRPARMRWVPMQPCKRSKI